MLRGGTSLSQSHLKPFKVYIGASAVITPQPHFLQHFIYIVIQKETVCCSVLHEIFINLSKQQQQQQKQLHRIRSPKKDYAALRCQ